MDSGAAADETVTLASGGETLGTVALTADWQYLAISLPGVQSGQAYEVSTGSASTSITAGTGGGGITSGRGGMGDGRGAPGTPRN